MKALEFLEPPEKTKKAEDFLDEPLERESAEDFLEEPKKRGGVTGYFGPSLIEKGIEYLTGGHITYDPGKLAPPPEVRAIDEQAKEVPSELEFYPPKTAKLGFFEDPIIATTMGVVLLRQINEIYQISILIKHLAN